MGVHEQIRAETFGLAKKGLLRQFTVSAPHAGRRFSSKSIIKRNIIVRASSENESCVDHVAKARNSIYESPIFESSKAEGALCAATTCRGRGVLGNS